MVNPSRGDGPHQERHRRARPARDRRNRRGPRPAAGIHSHARRDRGPRYRAGGPRRTADVGCPERCGGTDADQRNHRAAQARRPDLRHAGGVGAGRRLRECNRAEGGFRRRCDRQRTPGAHRRGVPGTAVCRRGAAVRLAAPFRTGGVGRRGSPLPSQGGVAGAGRAAHGTALRPGCRGPGRHSCRHLRHRAAVGRGCRRVHREVRHPGADVLRGNRIRRRCRGLDAGRPPEVLAGQTRQRGHGPAWVRNCASCPPTVRSSGRTKPACWR